MVLTKQQMIERAHAYMVDSVANHRGHICTDGGWTDDRDDEFNKCRCIHQLKEQSSESVEISES